MPIRFGPANLRAAADGISPLLWGVVVVCAILGLTWLRNGDDRPTEHAAIVVAAKRPEVASLPVAAKVEVPTGQQAIHKSEMAAAQPPRGGPGPADTRRLAINDSARFAPIFVERKLHGYLMTFDDPALTDAGFRDGDLLLEIDSQPIDTLAPDQDPKALLVPGVTVAVERGHERVEWRIGGSAA